jgi:localization factor PodJL
MSSQASWQTGASSERGADWGEEFPDQQSVEGLLRRLVQQVEETERRYGDALNDLQGRLDQLALTTDAARASRASDDSATLNRLHDQVSGLARRFEREAATSLDDFERLGRAVLGGLDRGASGLAFESSTEPFPSPFAAEPFAPSSALAPFPPLPDADHDLSKRLVEMAERLEQSVDSAMAPKTLDGLTARVEAMGRQIAEALAALPQPVSLAPIEREIAAIGRKLDHAESELARIGAIEAALYRLIERVDGQAGQLSDIAAKAATEAARLVSGEAKLDAATAERLDAMHRDLKAMNERSSAAGDRLAGIVEAVHDSLKQLVQQAERSAARATGLEPHAPFAQDAPAQSHQQNVGERARSAESRPIEARASFGRATRAGSGDTQADLGEERPAPRSVRILAKRPARSESEMEEDLVAAARRAAQAAARRAAERPGGSIDKWTPSSAPASSRAETRRVETHTAAIRGDEPSRTEVSSRRGRHLLVISAAVLLVLSAILLYSRLQSKPWPELLAPAAEESAPQPSAPIGNSPLPGETEQAPAAAEPEPEAPAPSPSPVAPDAASNATRDTAMGESENFTDIAKSSNWPATIVEEPADAASAPSMQETTQAKPAALQEVEEPELPPGVVFTVEDPSRAY